MMMRIKTVLTMVVMACAAMIGQVSMAQTGNIYDNFSPYTMYGVGMMNNSAPVSKKAMGGVGIASSTIGEINYLNSASLGNIIQRSALFSFGIESQNYYSTTDSKNAFNKSINATSVGNIVSLNDLGLAIPLARGVGFSVSLTPVSSIGYNSTVVSNEADIVNNIGRVYYTYKGEGGIAAVNASVGVRVFKGFNLGASLIYYFGTLDRYYTAEVVPMLSPGIYNTIKTLEATNVSKIGGSFAAQYRFRVSRSGHFTLGATYQLKTTFDSDMTKITNNTTTNEEVRNLSIPQKLNMPAKYGFGLNFTSSKVELEANYTYQDWRGAFNTNPLETGIALTQQTDLRFGLGYTPNRGDIRSVMNRWTYKAGAHYGSGYMTKGGVSSSQWSVTLGADVPLKINNPTKLSFGFEYGNRGMLSDNVVKEKFFKIYLGFNFFGDDMWFEKRKFN